MTFALSDTFPRRALFPRRGVSAAESAHRPVTCCARAAAAHVAIFFALFFCCVAPTRAQYAIPVRVSADLLAPGGNVTRALIRGDEWEIDAAILADGRVTNIWPYTSAITLSLSSSQNSTAAPLLSATLTNGNPACTNYADASFSALNTNLSQGAWTANTGLGPLGYPTNFHARFVFPSSATAISLNGGISGHFALLITLTSTNQTAPETLTAFIGSLDVSGVPQFQGAPVPVPYAVIVSNNGALLSPANFFSANSAAMQAAVPQSTWPNTIFVSTSGNDTNSGTNLAAPLLTLTNALTTASNLGGYVTVRLGAGSFPVPANAAYINTNVSLIGEGAHSTFIITPTSGSGLLVAGDNVYLRGFTFGSNNLSGTYYFPLVLLSGTNFYAQDLVGTGDSDVVYAINSLAWTSAFTGAFVNCIFNTGFDAVNCEAVHVASPGASTNSILSFTGCTFNVVEDANFSIKAARGIYWNVGNLFAQNCSFNLTNNANQTTAGIVVTTGYSGATYIATATVQNCAFNITNAAFPAKAAGILLDSSGGGPGVLNVIGLINPVNINNSTGSVNYDQGQFSGLNLVANGTTPPAAISGVGILWLSNTALYFVTTAHTYQISPP